MAEPIIVKPQEQSPVVVEGNASKTPIKVTTDMDYSHVAEMIDEKIGDIDMSTIAKEQTLLDKAEEIKQAVEKGGGSGLLEEFWDVVPEDSEEIISEEDIHAAVEDIWNTTFN